MRIRPHLFLTQTTATPNVVGYFCRSSAGDLADFVCNECGAILCMVPVADAEAELLRKAMKAGICSETCPNCGELNVFPGFTSMDMFSCRRCGVGVTVDRKIIH